MKRLPAHERVVERRRELAGGAVVDRPPRGDHAAHADPDEFFGNARGEARAIRPRHARALPRQQLAGCARQVAAVHEDELRHRRASADLARAEIRAVRQHDAARFPPPRRAACRFTARPFGRRAVPGDVHDAPVPPEQCIRRPSAHPARSARIVGAHQRGDTLAAERVPLERALRDRARLVARAGQPRIAFRIARGLADDERARVGVRRRRPAAEIRPCAACAGASRGSPTVARRGPAAVPCRAAPRESRRCPRRLRAAFRSCRRGTAPFPPGRAAEQRAADTRVLAPSFEALAIKCAQQRRLRGLGAHFGARPPGVERVGDARSPASRLLRQRRDEVVVGATVAGVERTRQAPSPGPTTVARRRSRRARLPPAPQRAPRLASRDRDTAR